MPVQVKVMYDHYCEINGKKLALLANTEVELTDFEFEVLSNPHYNPPVIKRVTEIEKEKAIVSIPALDDKGNIIEINMPAVSITDIIPVKSKSLTEFIAEELNIKPIRKGDIIKITNGNNVEYYFLFQNDGDEEADYLKVDPAKTDWAEILSKPESDLEDIDDAVAKRHEQNTDIYLDKDGDNEVTAEEIKEAVGLAATAIQSSEKGEPDGVATLDANKKLTITQLPPLAITNVITSTKATLAEYISLEWQEGAIQIGDIVQITTANGTVELWMLCQNNGSAESNYKMIDASKVDWSNVLNKPTSSVVNIDDAVAKRNKQQVVTVAKSGGDYTTIQAAINSITDASSNKIYTVLVYPGNYDEAVALKNYVDIVAVDPKNTFILRQVTDGTSNPVHCYLKININNQTTGHGLYVQSASEITVEGNITGGNGTITGSDGIYNSTGTITINGGIITGGNGLVTGGKGVYNYSTGTITINNSNITGGGSGGAGIRNDSTGTITINNSNITGGDVGGVGVYNYSTGTITINNSNITGGDSGSGYGVRNYSSTGTIRIKDCCIKTLNDNSNTHACFGGDIVLDNVWIYVKNASAYAMYASSAKNVYCMNVWANRDLHANITNLIENGFHYDTDIPEP